MSTVLSTVLIAFPPAFLAGWIFSKALFRQLALRHSKTVVGKSAGVAPVSANPAATGQMDRALVQKAIAERQQAQQQANTLREQLGAVQQRLQPLQGEVQLLKEAVAEREHQVLDLRRKLQLQSTPPEVDVHASVASDMVKQQQLLQSVRNRLTAQQEVSTDQNAHILVLEQRLNSSKRRARTWRARLTALLRQLRQQRTMICELREELRQRELRQPNLEPIVAKPEVIMQPAAQLTTKPIPSVTNQMLSQTATQATAQTPSQISAQTATQTATQKPAQSASNSPAGYAISAVNQENLQMLRGLGPALHKKLNEIGIYRLGQLAALSPEESYRLCRSLGVAHKTAVRNDWSGRARELLGMGAVQPTTQIASPATINAELPELR